jgi:hypothetical protein
MDLTEHNQRVWTLAQRMPSPTLRDAVYAIGFAADKSTGTVTNYSVKTLAEMSAKRFHGKYKISRSSLWNAIGVFRQLGVASVAVSKRRMHGGQIANSRIAVSLDYGWNGNPAELTEAMKSRRTRPQPQLTPEPAAISPPVSTIVDTADQVTRRDQLGRRCAHAGKALNLHCSDCSAAFDRNNAPYMPLNVSAVHTGVHRSPPWTY